MGRIMRVGSVWLMVAMAIALSGCTSTSTARTVTTDSAQRDAAGLFGEKDSTLCVAQNPSSMTAYLSETGKIELGESWEEETRIDPKESGPFPLSRNPCIYDKVAPTASVYNADGTRPFTIVANNPVVGEPYVVVICRVGSQPTRTKYNFSEGLRRTFVCGQFDIDVERMTDSETAKHFQANILLSR